MQFFGQMDLEIRIKRTKSLFQNWCYRPAATLQSISYSGHHGSVVFLCKEAYISTLNKGAKTDTLGQIIL